MSLHNTFVATYAQPRFAKMALKKMQSAGFNLSKLRVISHTPFPTAEEQNLSPLLGSFRELETAFSSCIPDQDIVNFEAELGTGHLFIVAHGMPDEIEQAKRIADVTHPASWDGQADAAIYYGCMD